MHRSDTWTAGQGKRRRSTRNEDRSCPTTSVKEEMIDAAALKTGLPTAGIRGYASGKELHVHTEGSFGAIRRSY
jgi:hypothetical protein